jgi:predicted metal-binding membrane protein
VLLATPFMAATLGLYLAAWTLMMAGMMLPSVAPLVALYARAARSREQVLLSVAYLAWWSATGLVAYAADLRLDLDAGIVLIAAGVYELTPLKAACLQGCRAPVDFLVQRWRRGAVGALRLGSAHALYCIGCCWALMAVLVLAAAMSLAWAAVLAAIVFAQKVLPAPRWSSAVTGVAFLLTGILLEVM